MSSKVRKNPVFQTAASVERQFKLKLYPKANQFLKKTSKPDLKIPIRNLTKISPNQALKQTNDSDHIKFMQDFNVEESAREDTSSM